MTDDRTLTAIDERARAAAGGVRTAVAERPVPAFDPDLVRIDVDARPVRDGRSRPLVGVLAAAAAVLVVVAAVVALMSTGDDDSAPTDRIGVDDLRRYVLSQPPAGYGLSVVMEPRTPVADDGLDLEVGPMTVYGPDPDTPRLGVFRWPEDDPAGDRPNLAEDSPTVSVPGRRAWDVSDGMGEGALLVEVGDAYVSIVGVAAGPEAIAAAAASVTVEGDRATVPGSDLPDGWSRLGETSYLQGAVGTASLRGVGAGDAFWLASYVAERPGGLPTTIVVGSAPGDDLLVRAPLLATTDTSEVEVRGHAGLLTRVTLSDGEPGWIDVRWQERPGEVVEVGATSELGEEALLDLAEGLVVVEASEVAGLRRDALDTGTDAEGVTVVGRGTFSTGTDWLLVHGLSGDEDPSLRTTTDEIANELHVTADGEDLGPLGGAVGFGSGTDVGWAFGLIGDEVAEVRVRDTETGALVPVIDVAAEGLRGWVVELPPAAGESGTGRYQVRAFGADGTVLEEITVGS